MNWLTVLEPETKTWNELVSLFQPKPEYRYKYCENAIIEMRFPTIQEYADVKCNEKRHICDRRFAKFRANAMYVLRIWDLPKKKWKQTLSHTWKGTRLINEELIQVEDRITYAVGQLVFPACYDEIESKVCTGGIHYFQTLLAAWLYPENLFWDDGETSFTTANGLLHALGITDSVIR